MTAAAPTLLSYIEETVRGLFPFLERFSLRASDKALSIRSANEVIAIDATERIDVGEHAKKIALAGTGPAALRVGDVRGLVFDPGVIGTFVPAIYYTSDGGLTFVLVAQVLAPGSTAGGTVPPTPISAPAFTALAPSGSGKVTVG